MGKFLSDPILAIGPCFVKVIIAQPGGFFRCRFEFEPKWPVSDGTGFRNLRSKP
jgi:hypothetical protein